MSDEHRKLIDAWMDAIVKVIALNRAHDKTLDAFQATAERFDAYEAENKAHDACVAAGIPDQHMHSIDISKVIRNSIR